MQIGRMDDRIDNQRSDVGNAGRQDTGEKSQRGERDAQTLVGGPDQQQGTAAVREDVQQPASQRAVVRFSGGGMRMGRQACYAIARVSSSERNSQFISNPLRRRSPAAIMRNLGTGMAE